MRRVRFAGEPEPVRPPVTHDAWGSDEDEEQQEQQRGAAQAAGQTKHARQRQQQRLTVPIQSHIQNTKWQPEGAATMYSMTAAKQAGVPELLPQQIDATGSERCLPSLQKLCLGVLGRHVTDLVEQLDGQLGWMPADVKAALLAVARRRGELTAVVLTALADAEWTQLDLAGCRRLCAADVLAVAQRMPSIRVLDVTGFEHLISGGWKQLALAWPNLTILRLGGTAAASKEAFKALPHILPGLSAAPAAVATASSSYCPPRIEEDHKTSNNAAAGEAGLESWEDAFESDNEEVNDTHDYGTNKQGSLQQQRQQQEHSSVPVGSRLQAAPQSVAAGGRLKHLQVLVWPDVPHEAVELVQQRCPRVVINPVIKPDVVTGRLPPAEVDPCVPLDQPFMELVGPEALQDILQDSSLHQPDMHVVHIADKFRAAYIQQAERLRDKERRLRRAEQRKQLRSSHALRALNAWLDEPA